MSAPSRTAASCRMRQSIQKQENKPDCACRSCKVGLRLLSGVYDGYGISPYEGQGRAFSCEKIYKSGFPKRRGRGCSSFPSRRVMRKRSGRSNASASAETVARSENCRARAFSRCCWGCCSDACADATARSANGRARACSAFCMSEVRFLCQRRHVCTYGEWQSAGVPPPCCWGCGSDACADTPERSGSVGLCPCGGYGPYSQPATRLGSAEA